MYLKMLRNNSTGCRVSKTLMYSVMGETLRCHSLDLDMAVVKEVSAMTDANMFLKHTVHLLEVHFQHLIGDHLS